MIKLISFMKLTKDRMTNPLPLAEIKQVVTLAKELGATHCEVSTVLGHQNFAFHSKLWADEIHAQGLKVCWRNAHQNMEGLYGQPKFVGANRKSEQFWTDEAVNAFNLIKDSIQAGDEEAIYPERTEGIFQDATSFLSQVGLPGTYGTFFNNLHTALKIFPWTVGLSANNASEAMSGWLPPITSPALVIDHYRDGDPSLFESEVRNLKTKTGKKVYVQEGAPSRFTIPTDAQVRAYLDVVKKLDTDGVLYGFGFWGGWAGTNEALFSNVGGTWGLSAQGKILKEYWNPAPAPQPGIVINFPNDVFLNDEKLRQATKIVFGPGTMTAKITSLKEILK